MKALLGTAALAALLLVACESTNDNSAASSDNNWKWDQGKAGQSYDAGGRNALTGSMDISPQDKQFLLDAASWGQFTVQASQLALQKSSTESIKQLAQTMVDDHTKLNGQLKTLAQSKSVMLPPALSAKHQSWYDQLAKLDGSGFETEYVRQQVDEHKAAVELFGNEAKLGSSEDIKQFASSTLPALQEHLKHVQGEWNEINMICPGEEPDMTADEK